MSVCNVFFSVNLDGQISNFNSQGNIEKRGNQYRVGFSLQESGLSYVFSVFKGKVTIATKGEISYTFTLKKGEDFFFMLETFGAPIHCKVSCEDLTVLTSENQIYINAVYTLDAGGNLSKSKLSLKVELL
jgi:hypothetical protein